MYKKNTAIANFPIGNFINATTGAEVTTGTPTGGAIVDGTGVAITGTPNYDATAGQWVWSEVQAAATNGDNVGLTFKLTDCMPIHYTLPMIAADRTSATRGLAGTALPNAAADAAGGLPISDAGGLDLDAKLAVATSALATPTNITAGTITTVTNLTNAPTNGDLTATMKASVTTAATAATPIAASVTGNVGGSVGSVLGGINTSAGTITTLDGLDTAQDTQHGTTQSAISALHNFDPTSDAVATVTTLTNLPAIPNNWLTAAGIAADALDDKGNWNVGKTGYSISGTITTLDALDTAQDAQHAVTQGKVDDVDGIVDDILEDTGTTIPATLTSMSGATFDTATDSLEALRNRGDSAWITATSVTVSDKTGFSLIQSFPANFADLGITEDGYIEQVVLVDTTTTNTDMRGTDSAYTGTPPTVGEIADQVWLETLADHSGTSGSTAEALNAAGSAGDPWSTALPGAYGAGSAGKIIGDNLNATVSSRASQTSVDTIDDIVDDILLDTAEIGAAGAGLTAILSILGTPTDINGGADMASNLVDIYNMAVNASNNTQDVDAILGQVANMAWEGEVDDESATTTAFDTDLPFDDGAFDGQLITITTFGGLFQQTRVIDTYVQANGRIVVTKPFSSAPPDETTFKIWSRVGASGDGGGGGGGDATEANQTTIIAHLTDIKGTGFTKDTHSLPQCLTAAGFSTHSTGDIRTELATELARIDAAISSVAIEVNGKAIYVETDGDDSNDGLSRSAPKLTIAAAVTAATDGDTIYVGAGDFALSAALKWNTTLKIVGQGRLITRIGGSATNYIKPGAYSELRDLSCTQVKFAAADTTWTHLKMVNVHCEDLFDAFFPGSNATACEMSAWNCEFKSSFGDGVYLSGSAGLTVHLFDCIVTAPNTGIVAQAGRVIMCGGIIRGMSSSGAGWKAAVVNTAGSIDLINVSIVDDHHGTAPTLHLAQTGTGTITVRHANYDAAKTSGTITVHATQAMQIDGTIKTLDALDTAQDSQHSTTQGKVDDAATVFDTRLSSTRAGYIDNLNVGGVLANISNASSFMADVSSLALEATSQSIKAKSDLIVTFPTNFSTLGINASGHVSRVTLADTVTTNTDMRGTDGALLADNYDAPANSAISDIRNILEADSYIDTSPATWQRVLIQSGTGDLDSGTEILRQDLRDVAGDGITATTTVIGQVVAP